MPIVSKATKLIVAFILIATTAELVFSIAYSWSGLIPLLASIGGEIVFLGLWIEKEADEEEIRLHNSNFVGDNRNAKLKSEFGWWILMAGIVAEIVFGAGLAALDVYDKAITKESEHKIERTMEEVLATGILKPNQIPLLLSNQQAQFQEVNNKLLDAMNATEPRRISSKQRRNFITLLSNSYVSKIQLPVIVGNNDGETENYAESFREMLDAAGFGEDAPKVLPPQQNVIFVTNAVAAVVPPFRGYSSQGIQYIPGIFVRQNGPDQPKKQPDVFAVLSDADLLSGHLKPNEVPTFMIMTATTNIPNGGELLAYHSTDNPNEIVIGICNALTREGISVGFMSNKGVLADGQAGFFIPQKLY